MTLSSAARPVAAAVIVCTVLLVVAPSSVTGQSFPGQPRVRLYDFTALDRTARGAAIDEARAIVEDAGVTAEWQDCRNHESACTPESGELVVRIVREPGEQPFERRRALGYSVIDSAAGTGTLATIYINRVETTARRSGADMALLLGRAIAHEIGHLLLRTNAHAAHGLMRATWTEQELARNVHDDWVFASSDRRQLRAALQRTSRSAAR